MTEYIYINGQSSVAIEKEDGKIQKVFIDGKEHQFEEKDKADKDAYASKVKRNKYQRFLENQFENLIILSGAGSSKDVGGKLLSELWDESCTFLTKEKLNRFCNLVHYIDKNEEGEYYKNLEKLLSLASAAKEYVTDPQKEIDLNDYIQKIQQLIKENCELVLPDNSPHEIFLEKITKRKVTLPRAKIFTLNYDTLFEQASKRKNFTVVDGFSFSFPRYFSGRNFDYDIVLRDRSRVKEEDNFITRVFHLFKPHGSVDWERLTDGTIRQAENVAKALMIYPKDSKYENSYEQPFFEMMSRFHQNLRKENVLLICIGFSFTDKHIVTAIMEALTQNPGFQLMAVNKGIDSSENLKWLFELSKKHSSIVLVDEKFIDFADNYPDMKSYNQDEQNKIVINKGSYNEE